MRTSWREIKNQTMTRKQQARAHSLAMRDLAELELRDLREALQITQVALAKRLKTTQAAVSRLEKRPRMFIDTLGDYVEALGGKMEVRAVLPGRTVSLTHFLRKKTVSGRAGKGSPSGATPASSRARSRERKRAGTFLNQIFGLARPANLKVRQDI